MKKIKRLSASVLSFDNRIKHGYYSDTYFNRTKSILLQDNHHPILRMQIFQRNDNACLCGVDEAIYILRKALGTDFKKIHIRALHDGDIVGAWETVMTIEGDYSLFAHLETVYLGALARGTRIATNVYNCARVSNNKPILFFPARFDSYTSQAKDGYSYNVGMLAAGGKLGGVSTPAQGSWWGATGLGTMPHALIAAYSGNTVKAALKFCEYTYPTVKRIILVDYDNDCMRTTLAVAKAMYKKYIETRDKRYKLFAVRIDTSGNMVDRSISDGYASFHNVTGVIPRLVENVYNALRVGVIGESSAYRKYFKDIGIIVSGGFTPNKIKKFEKSSVPVIAYGVGSSLLCGNFDFTADIVQKREKNKWVHNAKVGREYSKNKRLKTVV